VPDLAAILVTWGLRDYGIEPTIWGGEKDCRHVWGGYERGKRKDMLPIDQTQSMDRSGVNDKQDGAAHNGGQFCARCGAWRGCLGLEPTLDMHIRHLVDIFAEIHRVLRKDGTLWLNYGDCYASSPAGSRGAHAKGNDHPV